jgi:hypothetical protein
MTTDNELHDIKLQFDAIMDNYPAVYANHKANPNLPSAMKDHDKMEAKLTALYRRMFAFQAGVEKELDHHESVMTDSTNDNVRLNAILAKKSAILDGKDALIAMQEPFTVRQDPTSTPSPIQISMVEEAKTIERTAYMYSIARIVYLLAGIVVVSYFVLQTVAGPDSAILADAKTKAEQLYQSNQSNQYNDDAR